MTTARIKGSVLTISERAELVSGSENTNKLRLEFSSEWDGLVKQIDFTNKKSGVCRRISANDAVCTVPWEVLETVGDVMCRMRGIDGQGRLCMRTDEDRLGTVIGDSDSDAAGGEEHSPGVVDEHSARIEALEDSREPIEITISTDELLRMTADKTYAELAEEIAAGKRTLKVNDSIYAALTSSGTDSDGKGFLSFGAIVEENVYFGVTVNSDDVWTGIPYELVSTLMLAAQDYADKQYVQDYVDEHGGEFNIDELTLENNLAAADELAFYDVSAQAMRKTNYGLLLYKNDLRYVGISQGAAHAGEILVVGDDGNITSQSLPLYDGSVI